MTTVDRLADWIGEILAHHMLEVSADPVVVLNADDRIVFVSRTASSLHWSRTELIGSEWAHLVHPDDRGIALDRPGTGGDAGPRSPGHATGGPVRVRSGDGTWIETRMVRYHGQLHAGATGRDHVSLVVLAPR